MVDEREERVWSGRAVPRTVSELRAAVMREAAAAGVPEPPLEDLRLAVSEAITNAVVHGYRDAPEPGDVHVRMRIGPRETRVVVEDHGAGLAPRTDSPGLGLGMPLMGSLAARLDIRAVDGAGTSVEMTFTY